MKTHRSDSRLLEHELRHPVNFDLGMALLREYRQDAFLKGIWKCDWDVCILAAHDE